MPNTKLPRKKRAFACVLTSDENCKMFEEEKRKKRRFGRKGKEKMCLEKRNRKKKKLNLRGLQEKDKKEFQLM